LARKAKVMEVPYYLLNYQDNFLISEHFFALVAIEFFY